MNNFNKDLFKIAKELISGTFILKYKVLDGIKDEFIFELYFFDDFEEIKLSDLNILSKNDMIIFNKIISKLRRIFKNQSYVKKVEINDVEDSIVNGKNFYFKTRLYIEADLTGSGTEYCWDTTIDILKRYNFNK